MKSFRTSGANAVLEISCTSFSVNMKAATSEFGPYFSTSSETSLNRVLSFIVRCVRNHRPLAFVGRNEGIELIIIGKKSVASITLLVHVASSGVFWLHVLQIS